MDKYEVAEILRELGIILELTDSNPKKGLAYRKAAQSVENVPDLSRAVEEGILETFPGIGSKISQMISLLVKRGSLKYHDDLKRKIPPTLLDLVKLPGLSISRIRFLYEHYQITSLDELNEALSSGALDNVKGFGPAFIKKIAKRLSTLKSEGYSLLYPQALKIACILVDILHPHVNRIEITGALRRKCEVVTQVNILAESDNPSSVISIFQRHGLVEKILNRTEWSVSVFLKKGVVANLYVVSTGNYCFNLVHLTGSEKHLLELDQWAKSQGHPSFEQAVGNKKIQSEEEIYQALKLPYIMPELREGYGEVEKAKRNQLPHLVNEADLRGIFHCHTIDSDGIHTLEELRTAAIELGWEYVGISDHSKSSYQANGMNEEQVLAQIEKIETLNKEYPVSFQLLTGIECDVLKDGSLDLSDDLLKKLDFVIISIHRYFSMNEDEMTKRLLKAIENPYSTIVGHLTGRLLRHRDAYQLDIPKIIDACVANNKIIELNAYPSRLDMDWRWWIKGKEKGLKCSINPDAHSIRDFKNCEFGINMARKGWLEKDDVINTMSLGEMKAFLKGR